MSKKKRTDQELDLERVRAAKREAATVANATPAVGNGAAGTIALIQQQLEVIARQEGIKLVAEGRAMKIAPDAQPEIDQNAAANAERVAERERRIKAGDTEYLALMHEEALAELRALLQEGVEKGLLATAEDVSSKNPKRKKKSSA